MSDIVKRLLAEHDDDPKAAARELRELDPSSLELSITGSYSWLLNHVLGELDGSWGDAASRQQKLTKVSGVKPVVFRNHAVAALLAGLPLEAWRAQKLFAATTGLTSPQSETVLRLSTLQSCPESEITGNSFGELMRDCVTELQTWDGPADVTRTVAVTINNVVSRWIDQLVSPSGPFNEVMHEAAVLCQRFWKEAGGDWINAERACYLRALVGSHTAKWKETRDAATEGLELIDANGEEDVDKALLLLELARAYGGLSETTKQQESRDLAIAISKTFQEPGLEEWFQKKLIGA